MNTIPIRRLLADSSFYIAALRKRKNPFRDFPERYPNSELLTCGMVMLEVLPGIRGPSILQATATAFADLTCVPTRPSTWALAQNVSRRLRETGKTINTQDIVIAACALEAGASVLTQDKDFLTIEGLSVIIIERDND